MTTPITIRAKVRFQRGNRGARTLKLGEEKKHAATSGRIPRVTRLLALAHRFEMLIKDGDLRDYADLARLGHVTRARLSQIMDLSLLAPDIQEDILFLSQTVRGPDPIRERQIRNLYRLPNWTKQRAIWRTLYPGMERTDAGKRQSTKRK